MKKTAKVFVLFAALTLGATALSQAQIVVRIRPSRHERVEEARRPPAPSPRHVWVDEDWKAKGHGYAWNGGRWEAPPREGATYVAGHWNKNRHGSVWVAARWN